MTIQIFIHDFSFSRASVNPEINRFLYFTLQIPPHMLSYFFNRCLVQIIKIDVESHDFNFSVDYKID